MSATTGTKIRFTVDDYLLCSSDKRYELIDGELIMVPSPNTRHQRIVAKLFMAIQSVLAKEPVAEAFLPPYDVMFSEFDVVQPDLLVVLNENKSIITPHRIQGAPDWVIEVLSPGSRKRDRELKSKLYAKSGVCEYWIVDPENKTIEKRRFSGDSPTCISFAEGQRAASDAIPGVEVDVDFIFDC